MSDNNQETRERLFRAGMEVFAEHGYENATVREICRRAEANVAAVNYYFGDKKSLYAAIFDRVFATLRARRTPFLPADVPAEQRLEVYLREFFGELFYRDEDGMARTQLGAMYLMEIARPTELLDHLVHDYIAADAQELRDIVATLLGPGADQATVVDCSTSVAAQVLHYCHAQPLIERLQPELAPAEERIDSLVEHVLAFSLGGIVHIRATLTAEPGMAQVARS